MDQPDPREEIRALVATALAGITTASDAARALPALMGDIEARHGLDGVYQVAVVCCDITYHGLTRDPRLMGSIGLDGIEGERPSTPEGYRLVRFVGAYMGDDRAGMRAEFDAWCAERPALVFTMMRLLRRAWDRQAGGALTWQIGDGGSWPPDCDFCCTLIARHLYRCRPFSLSGAPDNSTIGAMTIRYTDSAFWYACGPCANLVDAADFKGLLRRYRRLRGPAAYPNHDRNLLTLWHIMASSRRDAGRRPLPKTKPVPADA